MTLFSTLSKKEFNKGQANEVSPFFKSSPVGMVYIPFLIEPIASISQYRPGPELNLSSLPSVPTVRLNPHQVFQMHGDNGRIQLSI